MEDLTGTYEFAGYALTPARRELRKQDIVISLEREAMDLLIFLLEHRDGGVSAADLKRALWSNESDPDKALNSGVGDLRRALNDAGDLIAFAENAYRLGVEFTFRPSREEAFLPQQRPAPSRWIYASLMLGVLALLALAVLMIPATPTT